MAFAAYEANGIALPGYAHVCWQADCGRWYEPGIGYFDVVHGGKRQTIASVACPIHEVPLYVGHIDFTQNATQWYCPHAYCSSGTVHLVLEELVTRASSVQDSGFHLAR